MAWVMHARIVSQSGDLRVDVETCNYRQTRGEFCREGGSRRTRRRRRRPEADGKMDHMIALEDMCFVKF